MLVGHIRDAHSHEQVSFICGVKGCPRTFKKPNTFYKHVKEHHKHAYREPGLHESTHAPIENSTTTDDSTNEENEPTAEGTPAPMDVTESSPVPGSSGSKLDTTATAAGFLLKLKCRPGMTQIALTEVVEMNEAIVNTVLDGVASDLHDALELHGIQEHTPLFNSIMSVPKHHSDPLSSLSTPYRQSSAINAKYKVVVSLHCFIIGSY